MARGLSVSRVSVLWGRLDAPLFPLVLAAVAAAVFVGTQLAYESGGPGRFVHAGTTFVDASAVPPGVPVEVGSGYDGQFYYRLALDPLTSERTAFGITLDRPAYRQQRILYPALAWALAGGDPVRIPASLVAVNLVAWCSLAWMGGRYAQRLGRHAAWGSLFFLYPGFPVTVTNDTTELAGASLLLASLLALENGRPIAAATLLTAAAFARETTLGFAAAVFATITAARIARRPAGSAQLALVVPFGLAAGWQVALAARWGRTPLDEGTSALGVPLIGLFAAAWRNASLPPDEAWVWMVLLSVVTALILGTIGALRRSAAGRHIAVAWILYLALAVFYEGNIWSNGAGFLRAIAELAVLGIAVVLGSTPTARWATGGALVLGSAVVVSVRAVV